jgi:hypothetical protein
MGEGVKDAPGKRARITEDSTLILIICGNPGFVETNTSYKEVER